MPYPLGFFQRLMDGRIDDPDAGWKGRGLWANYGTHLAWHIEGGPGTKTKIVKIQFRPDPSLSDRDSLVAQLALKPEGQRELFDWQIVNPNIRISSCLAQPWSEDQSVFPQSFPFDERRSHSMIYSYSHGTRLEPWLPQSRRQFRSHRNSHASSKISLKPKGSQSARSCRTRFASPTGEYLKQQFSGIQGYWSRKAREKGILSEKDLKRYLAN